MLQPDSHMSDALDPSRPEDTVIIEKLRDAIGDYFTSILAQDATWAKEVLGLSSS